MYWRIRETNAFNHYPLFFLFTEMRSSSHQTSLPQKVITSHRTRFAKLSSLSTMWYNLVTHNTVLLLMILMPNSTQKRKDINPSMMLYHRVRQRIMLMQHVHDVCKLIAILAKRTRVNRSFTFADIKHILLPSDSNCCWWFLCWT